jgi:hypothetical protein
VNQVRSSVDEGFRLEVWYLIKMAALCAIQQNLTKSKIQQNSTNLMVSTIQ